MKKRLKKLKKDSPTEAGNESSAARSTSSETPPS